MPKSTRQFRVSGRLTPTVSQMFDKSGNQLKTPIRFTKWMSTHIANDNKFGRRVFRYHPRSDAHSQRLCEFVLDDILSCCSLLREHVEKNIVAWGINANALFPNNKTKTLDLAIGEATDPVLVSDTRSPRRVSMDKIRLACEAKQCMTEHSKTKPRIFDELSSSHEIVHQGIPGAISCGIVVVNISREYASPTRQAKARGPLIMTAHRQPAAAEGIINHLKGLTMRKDGKGVGFDAFAVIVIDCDNLGECRLHLDPPAPEPGSPHHYEMFLKMISDAYTSRFS